MSDPSAAGKPKYSRRMPSASAGVTQAKFPVLCLSANALIFASAAVRLIPPSVKSWAISSAIPGSRRIMSFSCSPTIHGADLAFTLVCCAPMASMAFSMLSSPFKILPFRLVPGAGLEPASSWSR